MSPKLAELAIEAGHFESAHVGHRGLLTWKDHRLMRKIIAEDWTLVTNNSDDFRPRPGSRSQAPHYEGLSLHAGLVCLNYPADSDREGQMKYFRKALEHIGFPGDLVNSVVEVNPDAGSLDGLTIIQYPLPKDFP